MKLRQYNASVKTVVDNAVASIDAITDGVTVSSTFQRESVVSSDGSIYKVPLTLNGQAQQEKLLMRGIIIGHSYSDFTVQDPVFNEPRIYIVAETANHSNVLFSSHLAINSQIYFSKDQLNIQPGITLYMYYEDTADISVNVSAFKL